ncbi:ADP-ribosylglycohydrolase family protein [Nocardia neocaledoniensis]|uniref:ADP-ribosylglycohydrolase family protein n=1 Tax=Nocardia neocaledoniensis TaxID=236511 RepID=UPI002457054B|nr:ADP-ribosylglycohydrolase family protein [Nocardia neocaledoniensis]
MIRWWRARTEDNQRARMFDALAGLSVGDALGAQFFIMGRSIPRLRAGDPPQGPWAWTDDTEMAAAVVAELCAHGAVEQNRLAAAFARRCDPARDYGHTAVTTLRQIREGTPWRRAAGAAFEGQGSCGNGAAMRVAPLGAYFAGVPERIVSEATRSAEVTHLHPEGVAGAVAVAIAAGMAAAARQRGIRPAPAELLDYVLDWTPSGETGRGIRRARGLLGATVAEAAQELGNGSRVTAQQTVPFTLWAAATYLHDYPAAVTACLEADGDMDTTGAIVGGIVGAYTGIGAGQGAVGVPRKWLDAREPLPAWLAAVHARKRYRASGRGVALHPDRAG